MWLNHIQLVGVVSVFLPCVFLELSGLAEGPFIPRAISLGQTAYVSHVRSGIEPLILWLAADYIIHWATGTVFSCPAVVSLRRYFYLAGAGERRMEVMRVICQEKRVMAWILPWSWILTPDRPGVDTNSAVYCFSCMTMHSLLMLNQHTRFN